MRSFTSPSSSPTSDISSNSMRAYFAAVAGAVLVSSALPAQRMSMRLVTSSDSADDCTTVASPLLTHTTAGRHRSTFSLDVFAELADSAAMQPVRAVVFGAAVLQETGTPEPFGDATPTLTLWVDGARLGSYPSRFGHLMHARDMPQTVAYTAYFKIPREDLERLAAARTVTGTIGRQRFAFGREQFATVREFAAWAARSPRAPLPRPGQTQGVDCASYRTIVQ
jgi:hypothetical protein